MNLILLFPEDFLKGQQRVRLTGRRQKHALSVHRAKEGQELCVGLLNGRIGKGKVIHLDNDTLEMDVQLKENPPAPLGIKLVLALPRPPVLKRVLLAAASLGVKEIYLINSSRVEKTFWKSHVLQEAELREPLFLGLEQAKDTMLPQVHLAPRFKPFVEDELPSLIQGTTALVAHPQASGSMPVPWPVSVTLAVGPEGGFIPFEIDLFLAAGFQPIYLGERILRVETAVQVLLGKGLFS